VGSTTVCDHRQSGEVFQVQRPACTSPARLAHCPPICTARGAGPCLTRGLCLCVAQPSRTPPRSITEGSKGYPSRHALARALARNCCHLGIHAFFFDAESEHGDEQALTVRALLLSLLPARLAPHASPFGADDLRREWVILVVPTLRQLPLARAHRAWHLARVGTRLARGLLPCSVQQLLNLVGGRGARQRWLEGRFIGLAKRTTQWVLLRATAAPYGHTSGTISAHEVLLQIRAHVHARLSPRTAQENLRPKRILRAQIACRGRPSPRVRVTRVCGCKRCAGDVVCHADASEAEHEERGDCEHNVLGRGLTFALGGNGSNL